MRFWGSALVVASTLLVGCGPTTKGKDTTPQAAQSECVKCHEGVNPGAVDQWKASVHADKEVGCLSCHEANEGDADAFQHEGKWIAVVNTPRDCGRCHAEEAAEFERSQHAKAASFTGPEAPLAMTAAASGGMFPAFAPGGAMVKGSAAAEAGCQQCHGSKLALVATDGSLITVDELDPGPDGIPRNKEVVARIARQDDGAPVVYAGSWPNTGSGRINLDGSRGSCSACHSRHDFSRRRARRPDNCGKCHHGPGHGQSDAYDHSKHGIAFRDVKNNLVDLTLKMSRKEWRAGIDYSQAPTCATCHMSGHAGNDGKVTHDPRERLYWNNQGPISHVVDTDANGELATGDAVVAKAEANRDRMKKVCHNCHTDNYVDAFFQQYDALINFYNEKFARPGQAIIDGLRANELLTPAPFDEKIEWAWFSLWHDAGRQLRYGAAMQSPSHTQWAGMRRVIQGFYIDIVGQARELVEKASSNGHAAGAELVGKLIDDIMARPEHSWETAQ